MRYRPPPPAAAPPPAAPSPTVPGRVLSRVSKPPNAPSIVANFESCSWWHESRERLRV